MQLLTQRACRTSYSWRSKSNCVWIRILLQLLLNCCALIGVRLQTTKTMNNVSPFWLNNTNERSERWERSSSSSLGASSKRLFDRTTSRMSSNSTQLGTSTCWQGSSLSREGRSVSDAQQECPFGVSAWMVSPGAHFFHAGFWLGFKFKTRQHGILQNTLLSGTTFLFNLSVHTVLHHSVTVQHRGRKSHDKQSDRSRPSFQKHGRHEMLLYDIYLYVVNKFENSENWKYKRIRLLDINEHNMCC